MPSPPGVYDISLNLQSDDYAGQVGGRLDPETKAPVSGVIYDCNPHGHAVRPYVPPNESDPHVNLTWRSAFLAHPLKSMTFSCPAAVTTPPFDVRGNKTTNGYTTQFAVRADDTTQLKHATAWLWAPDGTLFYADALAIPYTTLVTLTTSVPDPYTSVDIFWSAQTPIAPTTKQPLRGTP